MSLWRDGTVNLLIAVQEALDHGMSGVRVHHVSWDDSVIVEFPDTGFHARVPIPPPLISPRGRVLAIVETALAIREREDHAFIDQRERQRLEAALLEPHPVTL